MKTYSRISLILTLAFAPCAFATSINSPVNGSTVGSTVSYSASAEGTKCSQGVATMGIYVDNDLKFVGMGTSINTSLKLDAGTHRSVVQAWDYCGGATSSVVTFTVSPSGTPVSKFYNVQATGGWNQWGELPPDYNICSQCSGVNWSMYQHVKSPSLSGNATQFNMGGDRPYSDVLWSNPLVGQGSTQGLPDRDHTLLPTVHHLTYDTQVYVTNLAATQDLEFDINMYMNGLGMEWGFECNHLADGRWDIWNNVDTHWVATNIPCKLNEHAWNRVSIQVQRQSNNYLLYQTLTVNGTTYNINQTVAPFRVPSGWWGMTANYQMDGNSRQTAYTTYLDNFTVSYW